jgi:hypothetical protein
VSGTITLTNCTVWVNGVQATQDDNGDGDWEAYSVPVGPGGTAVIEARAIPNTAADNNGNGTLLFIGRLSTSGIFFIVDQLRSPSLMVCLRQAILSTIITV